MRTGAYRFCPLCGAGLTLREQRPACGSCRFVDYDNPVPVAAAIVELPEGVVLVRSKGWPEKMFGLPTGFVEKEEAPDRAVVREVREELGLEAHLESLIGLYLFAEQNELIIAYHLRAQGPVTLGDELEQFKVIAASKLRGWPFATGLAVEDWLAKRRAT